MLEIILNWKKSYVKEYDQILPNVDVFFTALRLVAF